MLADSVLLQNLLNDCAAMLRAEHKAAQALEKAGQAMLKESATSTNRFSFTSNGANKKGGQHDGSLSDAVGTMPTIK